MKIILIFIAFVILAIFSCGCISSEQPKIVNNSQPISITVSPSPTFEQVSVPAPSPTISSELASYQKGLELYKTGKYQEAIEAFNTTISLNTTNGEAYFARGKAFYQIGKTKIYEQKGDEEFNQAIPDFGKTLQYGVNSQDTMELLILRGYSNLHIGENQMERFQNAEKSIHYFEMAATDFTCVLRDNPDDVDALIGRSLAYEKIGPGTKLVKYPYDQHKSEIALTDAQRAYQLSPDNGWTHFALAKVMTSIEKFPPENTIQEYDQAINDNPEEAWFYTWRGIKKFQMENYDGARNDYARAIELQPRNAIALNRLAEVDRAQDNIEDALVNSQKALEINPNMALWWLTFGSDQWRLLDPLTTSGLEEVLQSYDRAIAIDPENPMAHFDRWEALMYLRRIPEAKEEVRITKTIEWADPDMLSYMQDVMDNPNYGTETFVKFG
jgi:tetratricopeptide (TPR) repeat protein